MSGLFGSSYHERHAQEAQQRATDAAEAPRLRRELAEATQRVCLVESALLDACAGDPDLAASYVKATDDGYRRGPNYDDRKRAAELWTLADDENMLHLLVWQRVKKRAEAGGFNGMLATDFQHAKRALDALTDDLSAR